MLESEKEKMVELNSKLETVKTQTDALIRGFTLATDFIMDQPCECGGVGLCDRCAVVLDINAVLEESHGKN